jgi:hypothetical protein
MKAWFGFAAIAGIGFGIGFFAGERFGRKNERARREAFDLEMKKESSEVSCDNDTYSQLLKEYNPDKDDPEKTIREMDAYLAQFESPTEEDYGENKSDSPKDIPVSASPQEYIQLVDENVWEDNVDYSPNELRYFDEDEVFVDESDERVEEAEDSIGNDVARIFRDHPEIDEQFVINHWTTEIFRITRIRDSYARAILGMDDFEFYHPNDE